MMYDACVDELEKISQEKQAFGLGTALGLGAHAVTGAVSGHVLGNMANHAVHEATNIKDVLTHRGMQHALGGSKMDKVTHRMLTLAYGPEALMHYDLGHALGSKLNDMSPAAREAFIAGGGGGLKGLEHLGIVPNAHTNPMSAPVLNALKHEAAGTAPTFAVDPTASRTKRFLGRFMGGRLDRMSAHNTVGPFDTTGKRVARFVEGLPDLAGAVGAASAPAMAVGGVAGGVGAGLAGAATGVAHALGAGAVGHGAVNTVRGNIAAGNIFKNTTAKMTSDQFAQGFKGVEKSPMRRKLEDALISPAYNYAYDEGRSLHQKGLTPVGNLVGEAAGHAADFVGPNSGIGKTLKNVHNTLADGETPVSKLYGQAARAGAVVAPIAAALRRPQPPPRSSLVPAAIGAGVAGLGTAALMGGKSKEDTNYAVNPQPGAGYAY